MSATPPGHDLESLRADVERYWDLPAARPASPWTRDPGMSEREWLRHLLDIGAENLCGAQPPAGDRFLCTERRDHDGPHIAAGASQVYATWATAAPLAESWPKRPDQ